jgi:hypothetical protein
MAPKQHVNRNCTRHLVGSTAPAEEVPPLVIKLEFEQTSGGDARTLALAGPPSNCAWVKLSNPPASAFRELGLRMLPGRRIAGWQMGENGQRRVGLETNT